MKTSEEQSYDKLRDMILTGEFPVGEFLSQRMLAEKVGAAVVTVRSCLRRLENDGLIENIPKWGVRIPKDTPERVMDRYFMRETLEVAAVQRIHSTMKPEYQERLMPIAAQCDRMQRGTPESYRAFAEIHHQLHQLIGELAGSELLLNFLGKMNLQSMMLRNAKRIWAVKPPAEADHHQKYVKAILEAPLDEALAKVSEHTRSGMQDELTALAAE